MIEIPAFLTELRKEMIRRVGVDVVDVTSDPHANDAIINSSPEWAYSMLHTFTWRGYLLG